MEKSAALTDVQIRTLKPDPEHQYEVWDRRISGFGIRISPSGTKAFVLLYRVKGRARRITLGRYPDLTLADARSKAFEAKGRLASGIDPKPEKPEEKRKTDRRMFAVVDDYIERHAKRKTKSWEQTRQILLREFVPALSKRDVAEIEKRDISRIFDSIVDRGTPAAANHAFRIIRKFFNWCVEQGLCEVSPLLGLKAPTKIADRDRVLTDAEIRKVWLASGAMGYPYGTIVQLLLLTGQRRDEVGGMRWAELDLDEGRWTIPATRTKNAKPNEVPLSSAAIAILKGVPPFHSEFVFPARGRMERRFSGFSKSKKALDIQSGVTSWRIHDLRRTLATGLAKLGTPPHVVEHILNHQTGTLTQIARIYNRHAYYPEKQEALAAWASYLGGLTADADTIPGR